MNLGVTGQLIKQLAIKSTTNSSGGGVVSWAFVNGTSSQGALNADNTTSPIDTTNVNLVGICVSYSGGSIPSLTDSNLNTWTTALASTFGGGNPKCIWFYCINPIVGTVHTFTIGAISGAICNIQVLAFTKSGGNPSFHSGLDSEVITGNWGSSSGIKPGSITPLSSTSIFLSSAVYDVNVSGIAVNSSFIIPNSAIPVPTGVQVSYKIKVSDSTAEDPTWTVSSGGADAFSTMIDFN